MNIKTFTNQQDWVDKTILNIQSLITNHQPTSNGHSPTIALSGGSTPSPIYKAMQKLPNINYIDFYQVDERYIPHDHEKSNYQLIAKSLHPKHFHCFDTSLPIDQALKEYQAILPNQFDLIILGLGPDGHTASLFPHSPALTTPNPVAHTTTNQFDIKDRLTLTFTTIMKSQHLLLLLKGEDKQVVLDELLHGNKSINNFPAKKLLEHPDLIVHYCQY